MARALRGPGRGHRFRRGHDDGPDEGHGDAEGRADAAGAVPRGAELGPGRDGMMG